MLHIDSFRDLVLKEKGIIDNFVETGTANGETTEWASNYFSRVLSVELCGNFYKNCCNKFKNNKNIKLFHGDSSILIKTMIEELDGSAIWLLDAHAVDGKTLEGHPLLSELNTVMDDKYNHLIFIDDARLFGKEGFPERNIILSLIEGFGYSWTEQIDMIICRKGV